MDNPSVTVIPTRDGSPTLRTEAGVSYHSAHGALQESRQVFIQNGLLTALEKFPEKQPLRVFEMGFGTGLNAFLTALECTEKQRFVQYASVEKHPLIPEIWQQLSYPQTAAANDLFAALHSAEWNAPTAITPFFQLHKISGNLEDLEIPQGLHLIYFDAFAPEDHPSAWTEAIFRKLYAALLPGGVFTTYCSKGSVRRALQSVGFLVEKLPGPPGKREVVRAWKEA